jgi:stearoyl-CoA desaturase (delta-9 desaturase)
MGYHRLLTHRGFKTPRWLERLLATFGTLAVQSGPIAWVTTHRIHHAFTETDRDPHSPRNGTYWAHIGWIFRGTAQVQPESVVQRYSPDLVKDPYLRFIDKYYWVTSVIVGGILGLIGGWQMVLWGIFLRTVFGWHMTWLVNSATHLWGSRRFETRDDSRNNGLIAAVTFGEGWHNNHHAIPRSAKHGLTWREFDVNWVQIRGLEMLGLVKDVYAYDIAEEKLAAAELKKAA